MNYLDFEVEIGQGLEGDYPVRISSPAGPASGTLRLPFDKGALAARLALVQAGLIRRGPASRGPEAPTKAGAADGSPVEIQALGRELFGALFDPAMTTLLLQSQERADDKDRGLRIRLWIEAPELAMLPWEFLYDPGRQDYLTLAASRPLVRYVPPANPPEPLAVEPPLRILGVIASPAGARQLNVERERQRLELAVDGLRGRGELDLVWLGGQSARYLQAALRDGPWHVLHFIGHGGYDRAARQGFVVLANDEGGPKLLYAQDLARLVADHRDLRLVVLNACDGARGSEVDLFSSSAAQLVQRGTPAVVAMQFEITDEAAIEFSRSFYEALADGAAIDTALGEARKSMSIARQGSLEWGTPVLYTAAADGQLFKVKRRTGRAAARPLPLGAGGKVAVVFDAGDVEAVTTLARLLQQSRNVPTMLIPAGGGPPARDPLSNLESAAACLVVAGPKGLTVFGDPEVRRTLARRSHDLAFRIAPVLIPGSNLPDLGQMPEFLAGRQWVDLRGGITSPERVDELVAAIAGADVPLSPIRTAAQSDEPPFRGLQVFEEGDADNFFGREALTQQLVERLRGDRFLAVVGPSGSGKSSVVRAGLIAGLRHGSIPGSESWPIVVMKPGAHPLETLAGVLAPIAAAGPDVEAARETIFTGLLHDARGLHLAVQAACAGGPAGRRSVIVVDQFEEAFTLCHDESERERFVTLLLEAATAVDGQAIVVLTMRADFLGRTSSYPGLAAAIAKQVVLVTPMTRDELRRAIEMPARRAGLQFEAGVVDTILAELGGEVGALPLLEDTLLELWHGRSGGWLTMERYQKIGGVRGALEQRADALYDALPENQQRIAEQVLVGLVELGTGAEVTRRRAHLWEFAWSRPGMEPSEVAAVMQRLVDARLVTLGADEAGETVDVAHEALINNWQTLKGWIAVYGAGVRLHQSLRDEARRWEAGGRDPSDLRRGRRLTEATTWSVETLDDIDDIREFLGAGTAAEKAEEDARLAAEADKQRVRRRQVRTVIGLAAALIVVLAAGAGASAWLAARAEDSAAAALDAQREAEHSQLVAEAQAKQAQGVAGAVTKPLPGLADALEGWALAEQAGIPTSDYRDAVEDLLTSGRIAEIGEGVERLIPSPNGDYVIVDFSSNPGVLVRLADGFPVATLTGQVSNVSFGGQHAGVFGVEYADAPPELRHLGDGSAIALGSGTPEFHFPLGATDEVMLIRYSIEPGPSAGEDEAQGPAAAEIRAVSDGRLVRQFERPATSISVLPSADGDRGYVYLGDDPDTQHTEIIRMRDGETLTTHASFVGRIPVGGPATIFATNSSYVGRCAIHRSSDGALITAKPRWVTWGIGNDGCGVFAVSPNGAWAAVSTPKRVILVRVADLEAKPRWSTTDDLTYVAIPPGEEPTSLLAFTQGTVSVWRIGDDEPMTSLGGVIENSESGPPTVNFSPDGSVAVFRLNRELTIVRMTDGAVVALPFSIVDPTIPIPVPVSVEFGMSPNGMLAYVPLTDGEAFTMLVSGPFGTFVAGRTAFWPGSGGPAIAEQWIDAFGLPHIAVAKFSDVLFGTVPDPSIGVIRFGAATPGTSGATATAAAVVFRDGTLVSLRTSVQAVDFSTDATTSAIVLRFSDERSEIWDHGLRRTIGVLGLGVGSNVFDASGDRLAVRYLSGETYLIDVDLLRDLPADPGSLSDADLRARACKALGDSGPTWAPTACG